MDGDRPSIDSVVQRTIIEAGVTGERLVSIGRLVFCSAIAARAIYYGATGQFDHSLEKSLITYPALAVAMLFSAAVLLGLGRRRHTAVVLHLSVTIDVAVAFTALLPNSLWPGPTHQGAPFLLDTAALLVMTMASGLRHSVTAAALSGLLSALALGGLAVADHTRGGVSAIDLSRGYTMYGCLLVGVAALSLMIAVRTRRLVGRAARAAVAAEQAGASLRSLLRDHHDLRTTIASAQVNVDLLGQEHGGEVVDHLRQDLGEIRAQVEQVKGRALEELTTLQEELPTAVDQVVIEVIAALRPRFPAVAITSAADRAPPALVAGGESTLRRILSNLVVNACEGDGRRNARRVDVRAHALADRRLAIEIADDGPGLPDHVLAAPGQAGTTKPAGSGFGMGMVDGLVKASGGTIAWRNQDGGGALVIVELRAAR